MNRGMLLVEISLAFFILSLLLFGISNALPNIQLWLKNISLRRQAIYLEKTEIEQAEMLGKESFNNLISSSSVISSKDATFRQDLFIHDLTQCLKQAEVSVQWPENSLFYSSSTFQEMLYNSYATSDYGKDCGGYILPDQALNILNSTAISSFDLDTHASITSMDVYHSNIFVGVLPDSTSTLQTDLYMIDASNPRAPFIASQISFGTSTGVRALDVANNILFAAVSGTSSQFRIIDVSDIYHPEILKNMSLPDVAGSFPDGISIYYYRSKIYIGTHRTAGNEFHVFDVSDPRNPVWQGSLELNHNINAIIVRDNFAYLATSGNTKNLIILNISDPHRIPEVSSLALSGREDSLHEYLLGKKLYIGRSRGLNSTHPEFSVIDVRNPATPIVLNSYALGDTAKDIRVIDSLAFIGIEQNKLITLDMSSSSPLIMQTLNTVTPPSDFDFENSLFVISLKNSIVIYSEH